MLLRLYNSLTKQVEVFRPLAPSAPVKLYSCGPTVYDYPHIGNYRSFLFSDLLHRTLLLFGYRVKLVMNLTDIDDKTIRAAQVAKLPLETYTKKYIAAFFQDLKKLRLLPAAHYPRATHYIEEMVEMIEQLLKRNHAYRSEGSIYFRLLTFKNYGKLSQLKMEEQRINAQARLEQDEYDKENMSDFVLWRKHQESDGAVYYETRLGKGRPGWHIECSAMSRALLGEQIDLHTGGIDNRFPHHENEIAQSEASATNPQAPFVRYWLHAAHLMVEGEKMSKSLGNFYTLRDLCERQENPLNPLVLRYMLLASHYRSPYNFTFSGCESAAKALEKVNRLLLLLRQPSKTEAASAPAVSDFLTTQQMAFKAALAEDLNTAKALGIVFETVSFLNAQLFPTRTASKSRPLHEEQRQAALSFFQVVNSVFDVFELKEENSRSNALRQAETLQQQRQALREAGAFAAADALRKKIETLGFSIRDAKGKSFLQPNLEKK